MPPARDDTRRSPALRPSDPVVVEYLEYLEFERRMSANTVAAYRRDLTRFAAFVASRGRDAATCRDDDVEAYFSAEGGDGAPATVARRAAAIHGLYHYLVREDRVAADPAARVRSPKRRRDLPRVLAVEEVTAILAGVLASGPLGERDLAILELLYGCGLRASELVSLRAADVDLEAGLVRCVGKGDKERVVPLGSYAAAAATPTRCCSTPGAGP